MMIEFYIGWTVPLRVLIFNVFRKDSRVISQKSTRISKLLSTRDNAVIWRHWAHDSTSLIYLKSFLCWWFQSNTWALIAFQMHLPIRLHFNKLKILRLFSWLSNLQCIIINKYEQIFNINVHFYEKGCSQPCYHFWFPLLRFLRDSFLFSLI